MTELTDRMRTCAAFILNRSYNGEDAYIIDAANLLIDAAAELEKPIDVRLGPPMEVIKTVAAAPIEKPLPMLTATWYDSGPTEHIASRNACPNCDSRANKTVRKGQSGIMLECPVCGSTWKKR